MGFQGKCSVLIVDFAVDMAVTSQDVIKAFQSGKKLLVVDIRKESDYVESHIKDIENINVPENLISSG